MTPKSFQTEASSAEGRSSAGQPAVVSMFEPLLVPEIDRLPGMAALVQALVGGRLPEVVRVECPAISPECVRVAIGRPVIRVRSFRFVQPAERERDSDASHWASAAHGGSGPRSLPQAARGSKAVEAGRHGYTRIRAPGDVIKLSERLHYVLQPPVELLLADRALSLPAQPFTFQFEGVAFLYPRQSAILADEMGLGKTMQAITAIRLLLRRGEVGNVLLVCPKPLVPSWQREFERWAPELSVMVISGPPAQRAWQWRLADVPVRIANYELLCRDQAVLLGGEAAGLDAHPVQHTRHTALRPFKPVEDLPDNSGHALPPPVAGQQANPQPDLSPPSFDLVVLDEAQRIKNPQGTTNQVVRAIARHRSWALTGTPVENGPQDLVGIFEFVCPGLLRADMKPREMGRLAGDYVLRRTKDQVLDQLPPKWFRDAEIELTPEQRASYELAEQEGVLRLAHLGRAVTIRHVFELIVRLKQICNFDPLTGASAKLERLLADLEEVAQSGRKALVFSQWVETLQRLARHLAQFRPLQYHGRVPPARREQVIRRFRQDPDCRVLLLTYGAGGVGLNLQSANYVFLFDRWWNPAVEDQAINRAHRIGAVGPVIVTRFLTLGTIEERIDQLLRQKRELFELILSGAEAASRTALSPEELFGLFDLDYPGGSRRVA